MDSRESQALGGLLTPLGLPRPVRLPGVLGFVPMRPERGPTHVCWLLPGPETAPAHVLRTPRPRSTESCAVYVAQECLGHSVRPFHTTCIRLFLISYQLHNHFETAVLGLQSLKSLVRLVALPGVVGLVALEGLVGFSLPFHPF